MRYTTKELSRETWPDFESLFSRGNGWDHCWCTHFHGLRRPALRTRTALSERNRADKCDLVHSGRSHGILVYADDVPVGWLQFGTNAELPVAVAHRKLTADEAAHSADDVWRITCFVVDKAHRRQGVARIALHAALDAIHKRGGGVVEAYPIAHTHVDRELHRLIRKHGRKSEEVTRYLANRTPPEGVYIDGVGPIAPAGGTFYFASTQGTASTFTKAGFKAVAVIGRDHVLMRRSV